MTGVSRRHSICEKSREKKRRVGKLMSKEGQNIKCLAEVKEEVVCEESSQTLF
jgi:hypothetical protein